MLVESWTEKYSYCLTHLFETCPVKDDNTESQKESFKQKLLPVSF